MTRYSIWSVLKNAATGNTGWTRAWRDPAPKPEYEVVIVGSGHGMATAYYLARSEEHTSELQSLMRISYAVFCLKKKKNQKNQNLDKHKNTKTSVKACSYNKQQRQRQHDKRS